MNRKTRKQEEVLDHGATRPQRQEVRVRQGTLPATFGHWTIMMGGAAGAEEKANNKCGAAGVVRGSSNDRVW